MMALRQLLLLLLTGIALQHAQANILKDTEKLFSKLLKFDNGEKKETYDSVYNKEDYVQEEEEPFFSKLVKDTNKLFKDQKFDLFKPISFKDLFGKADKKESIIEKELKKIEEKKKDFDNKIIDFISDKTDVKKIFDKILDKEEIKEEKKDDYKPKLYPGDVQVPYEPPQKEVYKKIKYVDFEDEDDYDCKKNKDSCEDDYLSYLPPPAPKYQKQPPYPVSAYSPSNLASYSAYTPFDDYNIKYYD